MTHKLSPHIPSKKPQDSRAHSPLCPNRSSPLGSLCPAHSGLQWSCGLVKRSWPPPPPNCPLLTPHTGPTCILWLQHLTTASGPRAPPAAGTSPLPLNAFSVCSSFLSTSYSFALILPICSIAVLSSCVFQNSLRELPVPFHLVRTTPL